MMLLPRSLSLPMPASLVPALAVVAVVVAGCGDSEQQARRSAPPPPVVIVAKPVKQVVVDHDEYVGRFVALDTVEVRSRVSGYLDQVHFKDGQIVKRGDLLFTIDKRPFQNAVDQARANLALARSNLTFATADLERAQSLVKQHTISEQLFDQRVTAKRNAEASVAASEAALRQATLEFEFTELRAPVTGRIGDRRVSPGNLVTGGTSGNSTLLATIVTIDPIHFEFTFDEASFLRYQRLSGPDDDIAARNNSTPVSLKLIDEDKFEHKGRMDFVDNVIDRSTGTIRGRAKFDNPDGLFLPGMFARVQVPASPPYEALLIPEVAIGSEQARKFVYVVDDKKIARQTYVTLGPAVGTKRVVRDGLSADDEVIVSGLMRARAGQPVNPREAGATPAAGPPGKRPEGPARSGQSTN